MDMLRDTLRDMLRDTLRDMLRDTLRGMLWDTLMDMLRDTLIDIYVEGYCGIYMLRNTLRDILMDMLWLWDSLWDCLQNTLRNSLLDHPAALWASTHLVWLLVSHTAGSPPNRTICMFLVLEYRISNYFRCEVLITVSLVVLLLSTLSIWFISSSL